MRGRAIGKGLTKILFGVFALIVTAHLTGCAGGDAGEKNLSLSSRPAIQLGKAEIKPLKRENWTNLEGVGLVPADRVMVVLKEGAGPSDADRVAQSIGGKVVGFFDYIHLYQIETVGKTASDLIRHIQAARQDSAVELAFPDQSVSPDVTIVGVQCSPLDDPLYTKDGRNKGYEMVGVERAWALIRASKLKLSDVHVGVVDDGIYKKTDEFDGETTVDVTDPDGELATPTKVEDNVHDDPYGSHGTAVTSIIAANPKNGGLTGVASNLGNKLHVSVANMYGPPYGDRWTNAPDPNDPTKVTYSNGFTQVLGPLMAIKKQIESGATIINCSWGNSNAHPETAAAYRRFFEKMAQEHPNILFVCSAGNNGKVLDGSRRYPSGLNLPNMITVGNVRNDGTRANSSNMAGPNYEVTIAAPGQQAVHGVSKDGVVVNDHGGTSMATPHVAAAAALLRSIHPKLSAGDIKAILKKTALEGVTVGDRSNLAPPELGGGILSIDQAVLYVLNDLRREKGLAPLSMDAALMSTRIDLIAEGGPKEWKVSATIPAVGTDGTDVDFELQGEGAVGGNSKKHLDNDGTLKWDVTLAKTTGTVHIKRMDSNSCWKVELAPDFSGTWEGTIVVSRTPSPSQKPPVNNGECEGVNIDFSQLQGQSRPIQLIIDKPERPTDLYSGSFSSGEGKEKKEIPLQIAVDGDSVRFQLEDRGFSAPFYGSLSSREGTDTLSGSWSFMVPIEGGGTAEFLGGEWTVTRKAS
ncbi:subtilase, putative [Heliomicrobium modesticaldum Ice1]|uniref:Subtilase, putative n=1 Tax=Heliobacterium modesticaldum (strain ATCC 51547 / Ice1) TaxID=498761 RepID=B0TB41_HELMI|nr:S8 family serine peptidase [Heliomicrobium modesticaldum]ABZ83768.1 subtilase, putative [Heliomicrobium modesticaldum Ice1]